MISMVTATYVSMLYIVPATTTSSYPYCYSNYTSLWPTLLQQLTHLYDPYRYYDPWSRLLWQLPHHSAKYCYSNSYIFMVSIGTTTTLSPWSILTALTSIGALLSQSLCRYDLYLQLLHYNDTYCLNNYYPGPILQQLWGPYDQYLQLLRH